MEKRKSAPALGETIDALLQGRLSIIQSKSGYRFSLDALLLADFASVRKGARVIDLGSGNGVVALALAALHPSVKATGLEIQPEMARRAERSAALNRLSERVSFIHGDVRAAAALFGAESFDAAVANPPYRTVSSGRINPDLEKRHARHEILAGLDDFLRAAARLLKRGGTMALVYPTTRTIDLLSGMRNRGIEPKRLRCVHSSTRGDAALVLVEGVKGGRCEVKIMPPLVVYARKGEYSAEMNEILAGRSSGG